MAKIRVQDLARMMGIPQQDLMFKLKSVGVRVEGEDSQVDSDVLQAFLQGKKLPSPPREVILRDEPPPVQPQVRRTQPPPAPARSVANPLRPNRPRTMIHRVEPRIKTLPSAPAGGGEVRPPETAPAATTSAAGMPVAETRAPMPPAPPQEASKPPTEAPPMAAAAPTTTATAKTATAGAATAKPAQQAPTGARVISRAAPPARRPGSDRVEARIIERGTGVLPPEAVSEPRKPRPVQPAAAPGRPPEPRRTRRPRRPHGGHFNRNLKAFRGGTFNDVAMAQEAADIPVGPVSDRGKRRGERKSEERAQLRAGQQINFKEGKPEGPVMISEGMTVRDYAEKLGLKSKDLIKALFSRGIFANINHVLDAELAETLAADLGVETMIVSFEEEVQLQRELELNLSDGEIAGQEDRAPVVTIMGHVDHGKTTLLDTIRSTKVTESEHGGITQHIGAYEVEANDKKIVFLDTPGHEAFTMMRSRGASVTDIVVLVVAADDGVMPQTAEAIDHANAANVPLIVAINKIDKADANPDRVKKELSERSILIEEWGGDIVSVSLSALQGDGVPELLEMILLQSELLELRCNPEIPAQGVVLEARKEVGRGIIATVLVQNGTLSVGDSYVSGKVWGRVRSMVNDLGERIDYAGPATPVEVTGFNEVPQAGDPFQVLEDEAKARNIADFRRHEDRQKSLTAAPAKLSLDQLFHQIEAGEVKELPVILKADVQGSVEVLKDSIEKLSTTQVKIRVNRAAVGAISTNDIILASASNAVVIGFNVRPERNAAELAEKEGVDVRLHTIIYELLDELKKAMAGLLDPTFQEVTRGSAEVRETFKVPKIGVIAGCHVIEGVIRRNGLVRLLRDNVVIYDGKTSSLRRFKDDASEVRTGFDCGIGLERFQDVKPGDIIEAYEREEVAAVI